MLFDNTRHYTYRRGTPYPRIGESEYYYNVWYKFTNPSAYMLKNLDNPEELIGSFARQDFKSVKLFCEGEIYSNEIGLENLDKTEWGNHIHWETRMYLDTVNFGSDGICAVVGNSKLDELQTNIANILKASGAVVDVERMNLVLSEKFDEITNISKEAETLRKIIYRDSENYITKKVKDIPESFPIFAKMSELLVKEESNGS